MSTLRLSICKDEFEGWFVLKNDIEDDLLNPLSFKNLVEKIVNIFEREYGVEGAKDHVDKDKKDEQLVLYIKDRKVPNMVKTFVNDFKLTIQLEGRKNGENATEIMTSPFNENKCKGVVPLYNQPRKR